LPVDPRVPVSLHRKGALFFEKFGYSWLALNFIDYRICRQNKSIFVVFNGFCAIAA